MTTMRTDDFLRTLPPTPLRQHIGQIHALLMYSGLDRVPNPDAIAIAEHSLREIARYTHEPDWVREGKRQEELRYARGVVPPAPGTFATAVKKAFEDMTEVFKNMKAKQTPEQREVMDIHRYKRAVEAERKKGLAFVRAEATRVRKELGLPETKTITHVRSIT